MGTWVANKLKHYVLYNRYVLYYGICAVSSVLQIAQVCGLCLDVRFTRLCYYCNVQFLCRTLSMCFALAFRLLVILNFVSGLLAILNFRWRSMFSCCCITVAAGDVLSMERAPSVVLGSATVVAARNCRWGSHPSQQI